MKKIIATLLLTLSLHASQFDYIYSPETNTCFKADNSTKTNIVSDILNNRAYISAYMTTEIGDITITSIDYNGETFDLRTFSTIESCTLFTDMVREKFN
jgi:hypothetical protein